MSHDPRQAQLRHGSLRPPIVTLALDRKGRLLEPRAKGEKGTKRYVEEHRIAAVIADAVPLGPDIHDVVLFVHGWNTRPARAVRTAQWLFTDAERLLREQPHVYPALCTEPHRRLYVVLFWPSRSTPFLWGYQRIKKRAHALTSGVDGNAAHVVAALLGYLNAERNKPGGGTAGTAGGQYLTCVGHSFGGRVLCQAIQESALAGAGVAAPVRVDPRYPYTVDNLLVFQMAARPDSFGTDGVFGKLMTAAPISGPVTLTRSSHDRATGLWHRLAERTAGIGRTGVRGVRPPPGRMELQATGEPYDERDLRHLLLEVDASRVYRGSRWNFFSGGHSDIRHPESAHLLLSLLNFSR
ncbi:hypothetical protein GCM10022403_021160 [Streptomyces coacervatus]|uniref:Alpha/beta hydrolase n=1 Tax=Streptomyces coacervatus TaxID=647381 RepID=A0ABP7HBJ2_9ACTN|nr:hypothetical protein [Streptomyces coacervatus]MDF2267585.1 hypothetical protein [Streptomyces coacervatus]